MRHRRACAHPRGARPAPAGLLGGRRARRRLGLSLGNGDARQQGLLCELAIGEPAGRDRVRRAARLCDRQPDVPEAAAAWGWRIPFFIGCAIIPFLYIIRRSLQETRSSQRAKSIRPQADLRLLAANWHLVLAGMMVVMTTVSFYLITVYTPTFGKSVLKLTEADALMVTIASRSRTSSGCRSRAQCRTASAASRS